MTDEYAVAEHTQDDDRLERYVLGLLDEATQDEIEARVFGDPELAGALDHIETRLVDAYVSGALSDERREAFRRAFASRPRLQGRVRVARALAARPSPARVARWWPSLLAAAAVLLIAGGWFVRQATAPTTPSAQVASDTRDGAAPDVTADAAPTTATADDSSRPPPAAPPAPTPPPRPARILFAVTLPAGVSRAADTFVVQVPVSSTHVQLRVPIAPGDDFARYRVRVTDAGGRAVGVVDPAPLSPDRTVWLTVERAALTDGLFEVAVEGLDAQGTAEPLTLQQVRVATDVPRQ